MLNSVFGLSVSGISSGGFFAVQFHVAFSSEVSGVGVIAGGPYYCSQSLATVATTACMISPELINMDLIFSKTDTFASKNLIDATSNLQSSKVWLFSGTLDTVVHQGVVKDTQAFYEHYTTKGNITTKFNVPAEHSWVTNGFGNLCEYLGSPFINNCLVDAAGIMLETFLGQLKPRVDAVDGHFHIFQQGPYGDILFAGMLDFGYVYVPLYCEKNVCPVHVSFHGCLQSAEVVGDIFAKHNGINSWAESNNIVVIYPQILSVLDNPQGCWDFWGYSGLDFAYKTGRQMKIVHNMAQNVPYVNWGSTYV